MHEMTQHGTACVMDLSELPPGRWVHATCSSCSGPFQVHPAGFADLSV